ncbi:YcxB family protein [Krasilnikovia sp. MM14-A1259]|uniref:YcxB family protein n=1 Tax=Krasilnikovia sp. MM14-A1259 TaxID=3373539 RepID=UPI0037F80A68
MYVRAVASGPGVRQIRHEYRRYLAAGHDAGHCGGTKAFPALIVALAWRANPAARATVYARIDPSTGIHITQGPSSVVHTWPAVRRVRETKNLFLVELGTIKGFSIVLPKRSLATPEQMTYLRHLFQPFTAHK